MHERRFNPEHVAKLDNPERRAALPPEELLEKLNIAPTDIIVDLGAGTGYFAIPAATLTTEIVYALDVAPSMLDIIQRKATAQHLNNIKTIVGELENIPLHSESADCIIASMVLHEAEPLEHALSEIKRILRTGGKCMCIEWEKKKSTNGPKLDHRIGIEELAHHFQQLGFIVTEQYYPNEEHYALIVEKQ